MDTNKLDIKCDKLNITKSKLNIIMVICIKQHLINI